MQNLVVTPLAWIIALAIIAACWPLAQRFRHEKLRPLAAFLLFVSMLALVGGVVFLGLTWIVTLASPATPMGTVPALGILLIAVVAGFFAGRWIVSMPQSRRMPR